MRQLCFGTVVAIPRTEKLWVTRLMINKLQNFLFIKSGVPKLENYLNLTSLRHKLKAGNVANVATPGYKSRDISFEEEFKKLNGSTQRLEGELTNPAHIALGQHKRRPPKVEETAVAKGELNSVDIDIEISDMAQNELLFTIGARLLQSKFDGIRKTITSR